MTKLFTLFLAMLLSVACYGQEKMTIKSRVVDSKTRNDVPGVTVQLLSSDSTVIETLVANNHWTRDDQEGYSSIFQFDVPRVKANYIIRASYLGYKTSYVNISIGDLRKREYLREPLSASDTLSEATAPVKLPAWHCPTAGSRRLVRNPILQGWYPNIGSMATGVTIS